MDSLEKHVVCLKDYVNQLCEGTPPWKIILTTAGSTIALLWLKDFIFQDESLSFRAKRQVFQLMRKLPQVRAQIEKELAKVQKDLNEEMNNNIDNDQYFVTLPKTGWSNDKVLEEAQKYCKYGKFEWEKGCASGTVYNGNPVLTELMTKVYGMSAWTNPLHCDVFPGIRKMEAEVVKMCCALYHGGHDSCGTMTTGGTESIIMACKAYRDYAIKVKGIKSPVMLVPITAHAAFDKGAMLLGIQIEHVPINPVTMKVDVKAMRSRITSRTCMLVGSAPQFPHGVIDPIEEIAALGLEYNIPVHVDACLGSFIVPFLEELGYLSSRFDFRVQGVTSISCDTHKYGYAPKGSSVIMYREPKYRHHQFFVQSEWPGGIYCTPAISGSRPGGIIAACWAALVYHGYEGYKNYTKKIMETVHKITTGCAEINGIEVVGKPEASVVALKSDKFNIYLLSDGMTKRGWNLNALQNPSCIHIAVTVLHTEEGVVEKFIKDVKEITAEIMKDPPKELGGNAAIYGMAQSIPDKSIIDEVAWIYIDECYSTKKN